MITTRSEGIDAHAAHAYRRRAVPLRHRHSHWSDAVGKTLLERLDWLRIAPRWALEIGAGGCIDALARRYPGARVLAVDPVAEILGVGRRPRWWTRRRSLRLPGICGLPWALPLAARSVDLLVSNLLLPWCAHPADTFREWARVLGPGGVVLFTTLGPDSLREVREAWAEGDGRIHVHPFADMHEVGDVLAAAGLRDVVMDVERHHLPCDGLPELHAALRGLGAQNAAAGRRRSLLGRGALAGAERAFHTSSVTLEVVHGHAWSGAPAGSVAVALELPGSVPRERR